MTKAGNWVTAVSGDGKGFPDLLLVRGRKIIVAELKVGKNKVTPEQMLWLDAFATAGVEAHIWRPENWDKINEVLS